MASLIATLKDEEKCDQAGAPWLYPSNQFSI